MFETNLVPRVFSLPENEVGFNHARGVRHWAVENLSARKSIVWNLKERRIKSRDEIKCYFFCIKLRKYTPLAWFLFFIWLITLLFCFCLFFFWGGGVGFRCLSQLFIDEGCDKNLKPPPPPPQKKKTKQNKTTVQCNRHKVVKETAVLDS